MKIRDKYKLLYDFKGSLLKYSSETRQIGVLLEMPISWMFLQYSKIAEMHCSCGLGEAETLSIEFNGNISLLADCKIF